MIMDEQKDSKVGVDPESFSDFYTWVQHGVDMGWIGEPKCYTHDGMDTTPEEDAELEEGYDPCMVVARFWV
jgi:hypothetical protein